MELQYVVPLLASEDSPEPRLFPIYIRTYAGGFWVWARNSKMNFLERRKRHVAFDRNIDIFASEHATRKLATLRAFGYANEHTNYLGQDLRLEIHGTGCGSCDWIALIQNLLTPFVQRDTVTFRDLDIAVDVDVPFDCLLLFQDVEPRRSFVKTRVFKRRGRQTGLRLGPRGGTHCQMYDKSDQMSACCDVLRPSGTESWTAVSRIEIRYRRLGLSIQGEPLVSRLKPVWRSLACADLRQLPAESSVARVVLWLVKSRGFVPRRPPRAHPRKPRTDFSAWVKEVLSEPGPRSHLAVEHAQALHDYVARELSKLAGQSGIDISGWVDEYLRLLHQQLVYAITYPYVPYSPWVLPVEDRVYANIAM